MFNPYLDLQISNSYSDNYLKEWLIPEKSGTDNTFGKNSEPCITFGNHQTLPYVPYTNERYKASTASPRVSIWNQSPYHK